MGGRGAGSGGGSRVIGFSAKLKNGTEMRVYSIPGSKTHIRMETRTGTTIQKVNGGINAMMKNAQKNNVQVKKITAKQEAQYQKQRRENRKNTMYVNGGEARMYRLQRRVAERGRPETRGSLSF